MIKKLKLITLLLTTLIINFNALAVEEDLTDVQKVIDKFENATQWSQLVSMTINSETMIAGNGVRKVNEGNHRQRWVYKRDHQRIAIVGEDCLLSDTGKITQTRNFSDTNFPHDFTEKKIHIINKECSVNAFRYAGATRFGAYMKKGNYDDDRRRLLSNSVYGNFLDGIIALGGGPIKLSKLLCSKPKLLQEMEKVDGVYCYVIKSTTAYGNVTAWISPEKDYNAMKYIIRKTKDNLLMGKTLEERGIEETTTVIDSIEMEVINGKYVPVYGKYTYTSRFKDGLVKTTQVKVGRSEIKLHPDFEGTGAFKVNLPNGTQVRILDAPGVRYIWRDGELVPDIEEVIFDVMDKMAQDVRSEINTEGSQASGKRSKNDLQKTHTSQELTENEVKGTDSDSVSDKEQIAKTKSGFGYWIIIVALVGIGIVIWLSIPQKKKGGTVETH